MGLIKVGSYEPAHLSYSTVSGYRMCGAKFRFEKVLKLEQVPGLAAIGGNAVHVASEAVDAAILEHGFDVLEREAPPALDIRNDEPAPLLEPDF